MRADTAKLFFVWLAAWLFIVEPIASWWANLAVALLFGAYLGKVTTR